VAVPYTLHVKVYVFLNHQFLMNQPDPPLTTRRTVSPKHVLSSEILSVTSTMRKNSRWAASTHFINTGTPALGTDLGLRITTPSSRTQRNTRESREADLMAGFYELKRIVRDVDGA
jgi:golgi-specific brefeldin A-resistance guanine nucleotide exchange factor 1